MIRIQWSKAAPPRQTKNRSDSRRLETATSLPPPANFCKRRQFSQRSSAPFRARRWQLSPERIIGGHQWRPAQEIRIRKRSQHPTVTVAATTSAAAFVARRRRRRSLPVTVGSVAAPALMRGRRRATGGWRASKKHRPIVRSAASRPTARRRQIARPAGQLGPARRRKR